MLTTINVKTLRQELGHIVERVGKGEGFMVLYRSRPAFRIVPIDGSLALGPVEDDPLYQADAVGRSTDSRSAADHDQLLYGSPKAEG
ncbi:MAG: hypothetical protein F4X81_02110 [Gammaproteobacteria bacterium]|nr:hypothetical protein [Gammaproteobacteria bacterium]MDE2930744.1 hypothetical protein [Chloroflexota bacterium]MXW49250.1 hypothetical protein [Gammaproteobacteria bacterium]MYE50244.1 hypothetical protein [Gammaproteobacteria bacterium]MYF12486.1 hypothetical protein [Gammaproteobacteria bacterium]